MSPEQITGQPMDQRSDVFTAGVALATLLLNHNPFAGEDLDDTRRRITAAPLPDFTVLDSRVDSELCDILRKALERDPAQRYASAEAMMNDLERYLFINRVGPNTESLRRFMQELMVLPDETRQLRREDFNDSTHMVLPSTTSLPLLGA